MKKITIYGLHLGTGGTEKCIATLANMFKDEYEVRIVSVYKLSEEPFFDIAPEVEIKYLLKKLKPNRNEWKKSIKDKNIFAFIKESIWAILTLVIGHIKLWITMFDDKSDIVISTRTNFNRYVGFLVSNKSKKIAWEHNHHNGVEKRYNECIRSVKKMDCYVLNSDDLYQFYSKRCKCQCVKIPNSIDDYPDKGSSLKEKRFVSVGRLSPEKGYLDLIDLFNNINRKEKDWRLSIVGDGVERAKVEAKIKEYGLEEKITVHGYLEKKEINKIFLNSSLYLMTSYTESFGIVLIEAMSYGLPCVAYSSAQGARELIKDDYNGFLIENRDIEMATEKIIALINDKKKMNTFSKNARKVAQDFTIDKVKEKWAKLFGDVK